MNLPAVRLRNFPDLEAIVDADYGYARYAVALKRYDFMPAVVSSCAADGIHIYRCENRNSTRL